ncbi:MAG: LysM peptidoglycan-binding domain-containing protein [Ignavibacteriae bacterium]|nr:LysM peptidoglycan-binding domain-containing protein [Ignavibacteriota bacterium]
MNTRILMVAVSLLMIATLTVAQEMTKDEWQQEVNRYTQLRNDMQSKVQQMTNDVNGLQAQSAKLDGDITTCLDELYAMVGSDAQKAAAYRAEIEAAEAKADELLRLSDTELAGRGSEVADLATKLQDLRKDKLSLIPEFSTRLDALDQKVASLQKAVTTEKFYTVGRWSQTGDCLWNISKKKDIYNNAHQWPKIWVGNRSMIPNADIIHPGQKLKIPAAGALTSDEKAAARRYYQRKAGGAQ